MPLKYFNILVQTQKDRPELEPVRERIIDFILIAVSFFSLPAVIASAIRTAHQGDYIYAVSYSFFYLIIVLTTVASKKLPTKLKRFIVVVSVYVIAFVILFRIGLSGAGINILIALCIFSSIFFNVRAGLYAILISILTIAAIGGGMVGGLINTDPEKMMTSVSTLTWISTGSIFLAITVVLVITLEWFMSRLTDALEIQEKNSADLESSIRSLESQIHARKEVEEALRQSEERFRNLAELLPETIYEIDIEGKITFVNNRSFDHFQYTREDLGKGLSALVMLAPEDRQRAAKNIAKILSGEDIGLSEYTALRKDNTTFPAMFHSTAIIKDGKPAGLRGFIIDISERKNLEARLKQAEKMEALGTLAGGVAHDLNNILSGIVTYPDYLLMELSEDSPLIGPLTTMKKSGMRAAAIVQDLLTLARRGITQSEVVNINDVVAEYLNSVEYDQFRLSYPNIKVFADFEKDLLNIKGSAVHLIKTVMNLVVNSAEAMPDGGNIALSTENRYVDAPVTRYDHIVAGEYVVLSVSDNGKGINPADMERLFEPFFTTKKMGKSGTGLGLAVVWGTVKDHNGYVDVLSAADKGTTFKLYFPITHEIVKEQTSSYEDYLGRGESILVVDDFEDQRLIANSMLTRLGYRVNTAQSGESAVAYLKEGRADLILLDMIMDPDMDGLDTYKEILKTHPGQKAVIASGFSETDRVKEAQQLGAGPYIRKPYTMKNLGAAVRQELDRGKDESKS